jgi:hypothetical protein
MAEAKRKERKLIWRVLGWAYLACLAVVVVLGFHERNVRVCRECRAELLHTRTGLGLGSWEWLWHEGFEEVKDPRVERFLEFHMHPASAVRPARTTRWAALSYRNDETMPMAGFAKELQESPGFGDLVQRKVDAKAITREDVAALVAFEGFTPEWPDTPEHRALLRRGTELVAEHRKSDPKSVQLWNVAVWK